MRTRPAVALTLLATALACESFTEVLGPIPYTASLTASAVRPAPVQTDGSGTLTASLHQGTLQWSYTVTWEDLSSVPTGVHLHGPADAAQVGDLLATLNTGDTQMSPNSFATGSLDLTMDVTPTVSGDSLRKLLNAGRVYVDVHTASNTGGEIRGQLVRH